MAYIRPPSGFLKKQKRIKENNYSVCKKRSFAGLSWLVEEERSDQQGTKKVEFVF